MTVESNNENSSKIVTDGGFPRREFLSVLSGLALLAGVPGSEASEDFKPEVNRANGSISADCGSVTTPGPIAEMFAIPDDGEVKIKGCRAENTDERSVQIDIHTESSERWLSLQQIFLPENAPDVAHRHDAATDMATGETEDHR